jgi:hypothetical protein
MNMNQSEDLMGRSRKIFILVHGGAQGGRAFGKVAWFPVREGHQVILQQVQRVIDCPRRQVGRGRQQPGQAPGVAAPPVTRIITDPASSIQEQGAIPICARPGPCDAHAGGCGDQAPVSCQVYGLLPSFATS